MRIWARKSALIQPRTSLGKSGRSCLQRLGVGHLAGAVVRRAPQRLRGPVHDLSKFVKILSDFSKIITNFCTQYSIFQHFRNLQDFAKFCKIPVNFTKKLKISEHFQTLAKFWEIFANCCTSRCFAKKTLRKFANFACKDDFLVDLEKC